MSELNKRNLKLTNDRKELNEKIKRLKRELVERNDIIAGLENENGVLTAKLEKYAQAQRDGYLAVAVDKEGLVTHIAEVLGYSEYTFNQDIPEVYYHKNYNRFKVLRIKEGHITIDKQKLRKYKSIGGL